MYLVGNLTEIPDDYKGEETVVFYVNPFTSRLVALTSDDGVTPESVRTFEKKHGGTYLNEIEGINSAFLKKAREFASKQPENPSIKKVDISDVL